MQGKYNKLSSILSFCQVLKVYYNLQYLASFLEFF